LYYVRTPNDAIADVRVNGQRHEAASAALVALPWPDVTEPTMVRFYAVATEPASPA
jgi:hypothetical protein